MYNSSYHTEQESQDPPLRDRANSAFYEHMVANGFFPDKKIIDDGELHRFFIPGGHKSNVDGVYSLKINGESATGIYWSFRREDEKFHFHYGKKQSFIEQFKEFPGASPDHPYLINKKIPPEGFRQTPDGRLAVPMCDQTGQCCGIQYISPDGSKRFAPGSVKKGSRLEIQGDSDTIYITEGIATGFSVYQATGKKTIVAWDAGNLSDIGLWVHECYPNSKIIFAADNDCGKIPNVGVVYAKKAAAMIGADVVIPQMPDGSKCDWNDIHVKLGLDECTRQLSAGQDKKSDEPFFVHVSEMADVAAQWLIKNFIEKNCLAELFGCVGSFKTFLAIAIGLCIASEKDFFGHKVKETGPVLFIIGEGQSGFKRRMKAWALWHKVDLDSLPILVSRHPAALTKAESVAQIKKDIAAITEKYGPPKLIVIDTLNRNFGPGDENSTKDMTAFIHGCDTLRAACDAAVLVTHHAGHFEKERSRGSSALFGAIDFRYRLDINKDETINLIFLKAKEQAIPGPKTFARKIIDLGVVDDEGEAVTSCILEEVELNTDQGQDRTGKGTKQALMRKILEQMVDERDELLIESGEKPQGRVPEADWIERCSQAGCSRQDRYRNKDFFKGFIIDGFVYSKMYA